MIDWQKYRHFSEADFPPARGEPDAVLLDMLDEAREEAGVPFVITSGVRPPRNPDDNSAHIRGLAADIDAEHARPRYKILRALILVGFNRIGVYDKHIHADCDESLDQDVCWWGTSQ